MQSVSEMSKEELLTYCAKLKINGSSFLELSAMFEQHNIDPEYRRFVIRSLDTLDKKQIEIKNKKERTNHLTGSIMSLIIGLAIFIFGVVLYRITTSSGVIFIFNIVPIAVGGFMTLRGVIGLIKSQIDA